MEKSLKVIFLKKWSTKVVNMVMTSSFSMSQLDSTEMTLHGEESTHSQF